MEWFLKNLSVMIIPMMIVAALFYIFRRPLKKLVAKIYRWGEMQKVIFFAVVFLITGFLGRYPYPINTGTLTKSQEMMLYVLGANSFIWQPMILSLLFSIPMFMENKGVGGIITIALIYPLWRSIVVTGAYTLLLLTVPFLMLGICLTVSIYKITKNENNTSLQGE